MEIDFWESVIYGLTRIPMKAVLGVFSLVSINIGAFFVVRPTTAIKLQIKFYEKINWKISPVSMQKEVRNTRIMGFILIVVSVITLILVLS
ncbi:MAG: hypothetical protein NC908_01210 [Candidatus Omnitrophica bacterium]|nr:hypothetical protein [Candidatus Omnitrophota bacterium]